MAVVPGALGPLALLGSIVGSAIDGPFQDPPWIAKVFGSLIGLALLIAVIAWIIFAPIDLYRRNDIGLGKKLLWLAAFILSAGVVLVIYGAVRFSSTDGHPGW